MNVKANRLKISIQKENSENNSVLVRDDILKAVSEIRQSGAFDLEYYRQQVGDEDLDLDRGIAHYLTSGWESDLEPHHASIHHSIWKSMRTWWRAVFTRFFISYGTVTKRREGLARNFLFQSSLIIPRLIIDSSTAFQKWKNETRFEIKCVGHPLSNVLYSQVKVVDI